MTFRRIMECVECKTKVLTRSAAGHANYQEFAFPCPKCDIELRFGMTLDQENASVNYTTVKNALWRDDLREAPHERKLDTETLIEVGQVDQMMPFMRAPFLAKDFDRSMEQQAARYQAMHNYWPALEKMVVHQQNKNRTLLKKVAKELGYDVPVKTNADALLLLLQGFDTYGSIFTCDEGAAREKIAQLIQSLKKAGGGQRALLSFYEAERRLVNLWTQLMGLRKKWAETVGPILWPVFRSVDWDPAKAKLSSYTLCQKRFHELAPFYVDAFETLARLSALAAGMEGIVKHGRPVIALRTREMPLDEFEGMPNGQKPAILARLGVGPLFVPFLDSKLRNGIGHHSAHYRAKTDDIYYQNQSGANIDRFSISYIDFCDKLIRLYAQVEACAPLVSVLRVNAREDVLRSH
jgi:hypothetical protein